MRSKTLTKRIAALFTTFAVVMCSACTDIEVVHEIDISYEEII